MKTLLILAIATLAFGQETYQASKAVESNDVSQAATEQVHQVEAEAATVEDKKVGKRSHGWVPWAFHGVPWYGGSHGGHGGHGGHYGGYVIHGGHVSYGHGGYHGHGGGWYSDWYPSYGWPFWYGYGSHGGHGGHRWHEKW